MNPAKLDILFLGTGSAFCLQNWQSNMLIEVHEGDGTIRRLLLDCGGDARHALREQGYSAADIDAVYISHAHADHIGGLEWLALSTHFNPAAKRPTLFINTQLASLVWRAIRPGLDTLQGTKVALETYFDVQRLRESASFTFAGVEFSTLRTIHFMANRDLSPSYGLLFTAPDGKRVLMPTDTQFAPKQLHDFYTGADVIFQDSEITPFLSGVHAHYRELLTLPEAIRAKMHLYHYQDGERPDAAADGFAGFVEKGQRFTFLSPVPVA